MTAKKGCTTIKQEMLLRLQLQCPVCQDELNDARLLSCSHIVCHSCLKSHTEKNKIDKELSCPLDRCFWRPTTLYEGGVDNLPKFFFVKELKELIKEEGKGIKKKSLKRKHTFCSSKFCEESAVNYCENWCDFICQLCSDDHRSSRVTKHHNVVPTDEGEILNKTKYLTPYQPCHRHKHQVIDLYCLQCYIPICSTCSRVNHRYHDCIEIDKQAQICKTELEKIREGTDRLIIDVTEAMSETKQKVKQADDDIVEICENVKTAFQIMHNKLDKEEFMIISDLEKAFGRVKKKAGDIVDRHVMTLDTLEHLKSCQTKLADKNSAYDYVTVTESISRDLRNSCETLSSLQ